MPAGQPVQLRAQINLEILDQRTAEVLANSQALGTLGSMGYGGSGDSGDSWGGQPSVNVTVEVGSSGNSEFDAFMLKWIRNNVRIKGGGDVQTAFGRT